MPKKNPKKIQISHHVNIPPVMSSASDAQDGFLIVQHRLDIELSEFAKGEVFEFDILSSGGDRTWVSEPEFERSQPAAPAKWVKKNILRHRLNPENPLLDEEYQVTWLGTIDTSWEPKKKVPVRLRRKYWAQEKEDTGMDEWRTLEEQRVSLQSGQDGGEGVNEDESVDDDEEIEENGDEDEDEVQVVEVHANNNDGGKFKS
ncbi:chromo domain-containing protein [Colletotrichum sp. SAR11_240]|nr:chromo domain-containing protein [Colletotrichum sp. SAR11_240]